MRLVNTLTLQLERFHEDDLPEYAILSHRWEDEEIALSQLSSGEAILTRRFDKLVNFCRVAHMRGCRYAWMDTCCIDQKDPTELSEAINSMYRWYSNAKVCIVFLNDIVSIDYLHKSCWFTRGWTLQELIAPKHVDFYGQHWNFIGQRASLLRELTTITNVPILVLAGASPQICSIAQRMSWAAGRTTTRLEDRAYSLLGLFGVSMHATYGIGEEAFIKLQEAIMQKSHDQSIFAWRTGFSSHHPRGLSGLLARSPSAFDGCYDTVRSEPSGLDARFQLGQIGLEINLYLMPVFMNIYLAILDCRPNDERSTRYGIFLERSPGSAQYNRVHFNGSSLRKIFWPRNFVPEAFGSHHIFVRQRVENLYPDIIYGFRIGRIKLPGHSDFAIQNAHFWSRFSWAGELASDYLFIPQDKNGMAGGFSISDTFSSKRSNSVQWMKFGFDNSFQPVVVVGDRRSKWTGTAFSDCSGSASASSSDREEDRELSFAWNLEGAKNHKVPTPRHCFFLTSKSSDAWNHPLASRKSTSKHFGISVTFELKPYEGSDWAPGCRQMVRPRIWTINVEPHEEHLPQGRVEKAISTISSEKTMTRLLGVTGMSFLILGLNLGSRKTPTI